VVVDDPSVKKNIRLIVLIVSVFAVLTIGSVAKKLSGPRILNIYQLRDYGVIMLEEPSSLGDFALMDTNGQAFGSEQLQGLWTMVFFGFSSCVDTCSTTMAELADMYKALEPDERADLNIVMVTVDPERDTPEALAQYLSRFNPDFLGLRGSHAELTSFAKQLYVAYEPELGKKGNYQVTHSGNLMLINPEGKLQGYVRPPFAHGSLRVAWRSIRETF